MIAKLITIIKSRFQQQREELWVKTRREICLGCEYNSLNTQRTSLTHDFLATLSYFFSWITGRAEEDNLGNCLACEACSIYFKTAEEDEICKHPKENKWKKGEHLNIYKQRKDANKKDNR